VCGLAITWGASTPEFHTPGLPAPPTSRPPTNGYPPGHNSDLRSSGPGIPRPELRSLPDLECCSLRGTLSRRSYAPEWPAFEGWHMMILTGATENLTVAQNGYPSCVEWVIAEYTEPESSTLVEAMDYYLGFDPVTFGII